MKRTRKVKASPQKEPKFKSGPDPEAEPTWQSVIVEAEQQMAELRRTIEWARQYARSRLGLTGGASTTS